MRQVGTIPEERSARRLGDHLLTLGIRVQIEPGETGWAVWAIDEDRVADAKTEVQKFLENPTDPRYVAAEEFAGQLRAAAEQRDKQIRKNIIDVRSQWTHPSANRPVTMLLIGISVIATFMTNFGSDSANNAIFQKLAFLPIHHDTSVPYPYTIRLTSERAEIRQGEVWRLVTPIFLHLDGLHLLFNMMWLNSLGGVIEIRRGSWRLALMVLFIAITSNFSQYLWNGPGFGGMSGVGFGLFGYVWMKSRYDPDAGMYIDPASVTMMLFWLILCMTGAIGPIANAAHLVGLLAGIVVAVIPIGWRRIRRG